MRGSGCQGPSTPVHVEAQVSRVRRVQPVRGPVHGRPAEPGEDERPGGHRVVPAAARRRRAIHRYPSSARSGVDASGPWCASAARARPAGALPPLLVSGKRLPWVARGGESIRFISRCWGWSPSTISRELARKADPRGGYRATTAHPLAKERASRPKPSQAGDQPGPAGHRLSWTGRRSRAADRFRGPSLSSAATPFRRLLPTLP